MLITISTIGSLRLLVPSRSMAANESGTSSGKVGHGRHAKSSPASRFVHASGQRIESSNLSPSSGESPSDVVAAILRAAASCTPASRGTLGVVVGQREARRDRVGSEALVERARLGGREAEPVPDCRETLDRVRALDPGCECALWKRLLDQQAFNTPMGNGVSLT